MAGDESAAIIAVAEVAADAEVRAEIAADVADSVIENAQERIDEAQETARQIAEAAMQTEIGRRVDALEGKVNYEWQEQLAALSTQLATLAQTVSEIQQQMAATATLAVTSALTDTSQLTPAQSSSPLAEAITEAQQVLPETLGQSAVVESPAPPPARSKRLWM